MNERSGGPGRRASIYLSPRRATRGLTAAVAVVLSWTAGLGAGARAADELNALVWCDHTDAALIEPFEKKFGVRVNTKEYEGTGTALSIIEQSRPGDWDVWVIDGVDVPRAIDLGLLATLPADQLPLADVFEQVRMTDVTQRDGNTYAIIEKFGYNTIAYNRANVDSADMTDIAVMWNEKYKDRIAIYDYYIPVMDMVALGLGMKPNEISEATLPKIRDGLFRMKDVARTVSDVVASQTALATGEVDILIGGGEWAIATLTDENPDFEWVLPAQGGILWAQSLAVFETSQRKDLAVEFVKYVMSPEGQARLATSSCFWGMPANSKAGAHLTDEQKRRLRWDKREEYLANSYRYFIPDAELDAKMLDVWTEMLQH